uniref:Uncharacterized protein n=1 Tax=Anguilla anguilla TaxID=7936 RepID=A0A0E9TK74_ANGAN
MHKLMHWCTYTWCVPIRNKHMAVSCTELCLCLGARRLHDSSSNVNYFD